jgi:hypothetical protein
MVRTSGSAIAYIHTRAPSTMTQINTNAQRLTVMPYRVNRGRFMPRYPLINVYSRFYGVISDQVDASLAQLAAKGLTLWDPVQAQLIWLSRPEGDYNELYGGSGAIQEIIPDMHADRTSAREYTTVRLNPGAELVGMTEHSRQGWAAAALRIVDDDQNGPLLALTVGESEVSIELYGNEYRAMVDDVVFATHVRASSDRFVTVIGLSIYFDRVTVVIREGALPATYEYLTTFPLSFNQFVVGGPSCPELLLYAAACSTTTSIQPFMASVIGYLSC